MAHATTALSTSRTEKRATADRVTAPYSELDTRPRNGTISGRPRLRSWWQRGGPERRPRRFESELEPRGLGLQWDDVDLERGSLTVRHTLARIDGKRVLAEPKTEQS